MKGVLWMFLALLIMPLALVGDIVAGDAQRAVLTLWGFSALFANRREAAQGGPGSEVLPHDEPPPTLLPLLYPADVKLRLFPIIQGRAD